MDVYLSKIMHHSSKQYMAEKQVDKIDLLTNFEML